MTVELGNINKGIPMGSYTPSEGGGGGGATNVTGVDPIAVTNGSVAIKIDEQTLQVNEQGELSANLDEIGSELNDLSGRVTAAEADMLTKQDKLTAGDNITISTDNVISATGGSTPSNMVTTNTNQDITGAKSFTVGLTTFKDTSTNRKILGEVNGNGFYCNYYTDRASGEKPCYIGKVSDKMFNMGVPDLTGVTGRIFANTLTKWNGANEVGTILDSSNLGSYVDGTTITYSGNRLSAVSGGGGDVSSSADNTFTGKNTFKGTVCANNIQTTDGDRLIEYESGTLQIGNNDSIQSIAIRADGPITDATGNAFVTEDMIATTSSTGLVKVDGTTITVDNEGKISAVGGGGSTSAEKYGIEGDYSSKYGILECPNGIFTVSDMTMTLQPGVVMQCAGSESKTTNSSAMAHTVTSTIDFDIFYTSGQFIEATQVVFSTEEPENGATGYLAWWDPSRADKKWQFKSNDSGNVWAAAAACRLAHVHTDGTTITRVDYIGNRQMDDGVFVDANAGNTFTGENTFKASLTLDATGTTEPEIRVKYTNDAGSLTNAPLVYPQNFSLGESYATLNIGTSKLKLVLQGSSIKDNNNAEFVRLVKSYIQGTEGYFLYDNDWCVQYGRGKVPPSAYATIELLTPYADTNYIRLLTLGDRPDSATWAIYPKDRTASSFNVSASLSGYDLGFDWVTMGFIAKES